MAMAVKLFEMQRISSGIALKDSVRIKKSLPVQPKRDQKGVINLCL